MNDKTQFFGGVQFVSVQSQIFKYYYDMEHFVNSALSQNLLSALSKYVLP